MATTLDALGKTLRDAFPVSEGLYGYEVVNPESPVGADGRITVRLLVWEETGGQRSIRDIKEQELFLLDPGYLSGDVPLHEFLRGWADAIREVFRNPKPGVVDTLMPHDFLDDAVLKLRRAKTAADYKAAFLAKSRLGRWLNTP